MGLQLLMCDSLKSCFIFTLCCKYGIFRFSIYLFYIKINQIPPLKLKEGQDTLTCLKYIRSPRVLFQFLKGWVADNSAAYLHRRFLPSPLFLRPTLNAYLNNIAKDISIAPIFVHVYHSSPTVA